MPPVAIVALGYCVPSFLLGALLPPYAAALSIHNPWAASCLCWGERHIMQQHRFNKVCSRRCMYLNVRTARDCISLCLVPVRKGGRTGVVRRWNLVSVFFSQMALSKSSSNRNVMLLVSQFFMHSQLSNHAGEAGSLSVLWYPSKYHCWVMKVTTCSRRYPCWCLFFFWVTDHCRMATATVGCCAHSTGF